MSRVVVLDYYQSQNKMPFPQHLLFVTVFVKITFIRLYEFVL